MSDASAKVVNSGIQQHFTEL